MATIDDSNSLFKTIFERDLCYFHLHLPMMSYILVINYAFR